jgi:hypothetical protein
MRADSVHRFGAVLVAAMLCSSFHALAAGENIDPGNDDHQYAWSENFGWVNAEPLGNAGPGVEVADFQLTGWMWGENFGWLSLSCTNTASCGAASYGVSNDGSGVLSGFAWSENQGWINFKPVTCAPDPTCGVRIDPATGFFVGRAWGENAGWITFSNGTPVGSTVRTSWCQSIVAPPGSAFTLSAGKSGPALTLAWTVLANAASYDIVSGALSTLRSTAGNYTAATQQCVASKLVATGRTVAGPNPPAGDGVWFIVRGANCRGRGTYDGSSPKQIGSRDAEIAASPSACP